MAGLQLPYRYVHGFHGQQNYAFNEADHPRASDGRFGDKAGSHDGGGDEAAPSKNVKVGDKGNVTIKKPKSAVEAKRLMGRMNELLRAAQDDFDALAHIDANDPRSQKAEMRLKVISDQHKQASAMAKPFMDSPDDLLEAIFAEKPITYPKGDANRDRLKSKLDGIAAKQNARAFQAELRFLTKEEQEYVLAKRAAMHSEKSNVVPATPANPKNIGG